MRRNKVDYRVFLGTVCLLFGITAFTAVAQETYSLELPTEIDYATLERSFWLDSLVDARPDKSCVGFATVDRKTGRKALLEPSEGLLPMLKTHFKFLMRPPVKKSRVPLVLEVKKLWIAENPISTLPAVNTEVEVVVYRRIGNELSLFYERNVYGSSSAGNPQKALQKSLGDALSKIISDVNRESKRFQAMEAKTGDAKATVLIPLKTDSLLTLPNRKFYIENILDARPDTSLIGVVQHGTKRDVQANLKGGFLPTLREYVFFRLPNLNDRYEPLTMEVSQFIISTVSDLGRFEMEVSFFRKDSSGTYQRLFSASVLEESRELGLTASHPKRIKEGLQRALVALNAYLNDPQHHEPVYEEFDRGMRRFLKTAEDAKNTYPATLTLPEDDIAHCTRPRNGIYVRLDELQTNRPAISPAYAVLRSADSSLVWINDLQGKRVKGNFWGFSDGIDVYLHARRYNFRNYYCKVPVRGRYLAWIDPAAKPSDMTAALIPASVVGGLIGGALTGAASSLLNSGRTACLVMDTKTGLIASLSEKKLWELCRDEPDLLLKINQPGNLKDPARLDLIRELNRRHSN